jgi:hypothetical protein
MQALRHTLQCQLLDQSESIAYVGFAAAERAFMPRASEPG